MSAQAPQWLDDVFKSAKADFLKKLKSPAQYDFSKLTTIEETTEKISEIEKSQAKTKTLRGLGRIKPLVDALTAYAGVIEVFVQVKPEIMSLIWGPLKFLLQASSSLISAFEKVVKVFGEIGDILPSFTTYGTLFDHNPNVRRAICLFYTDILDLYAVLLNFFSNNRRRNIILEPLWPNIRPSLDNIKGNIEHHKSIMTVNVTLEHVVQAHSARQKAFEEREQAQHFRESQSFRTVCDEIRPYNHLTRLAHLEARSSVDSGQWLGNDQAFVKWLDVSDATTRCLWLHGIPGSGKTFIAAHAARSMLNESKQALVIFLSHEDQEIGNVVKVLHSLIFQILEEKSASDLRPVLHEAFETDRKKLKDSVEFVTDLLCKIFNSFEPTFVILDGLDELEVVARKHLLATMLKIHDQCPQTKLLISSRNETDISSLLKDRALQLAVASNNFECIRTFVQLESRDMLDEMQECGANSSELSKIQVALNSISEKAKGMFLYAKLVMCMVKDHRSLPNIEVELANLPDGLDQAYGRIISKVATNKNQLTIMRNVLQWIACAQRPLREEELLQILIIKPGQSDFEGDARKVFRNLQATCGPIIEVEAGMVRFVHFSAKEYLLHDQSGKFINLADAHLNAALVCATYLTFHSLDILFSGERSSPIESQLAGGDFVLLEYASFAYLEHIKASLRTPSGKDSAGQPSLSPTLNRLMETRQNEDWEAVASPELYTEMFECFESQPELQEFFASVASFTMKAQLGILGDKNGLLDLSKHDPLTINAALGVFREGLQHWTTPRPPPSLYGSRLFLCDRLFCQAYHDGFDTTLARDQHLKTHVREFNCEVSTCPYSSMGFHTAAKLHRHATDAHARRFEVVASPDANFLNSRLRLPIDDLCSIFEDAIKNHQIETVRILSASIYANKAMPLWRRQECCFLAAWTASSEMLSILLDCFPYPDDKSSKLEHVVSHHTDCLAWAIESQNRPNIHFLLSKGADMSRHIWTKSSLQDFVPQQKHRNIWDPQCGYIRALSHWDYDFVKYLENDCAVVFPLGPDNPDQDNCNDRSIFSVFSRKISATPEDLAQRLKKIKPYIIWRDGWKRAVADAAVEGLVDNVRAILENGGDPNSVRSLRPGKRENGAFYHAVKNGKNPEAAEMIKLLIMHGLDLNSKESIRVRKFAGIRKVEKYFGLLWKDIVARTQAGEDLQPVS